MVSEQPKERWHRVARGWEGGGQGHLRGDTYAQEGRGETWGQGTGRREGQGQKLPSGLRGWVSKRWRTASQAQWGTPDGCPAHSLSCSPRAFHQLRLFPVSAQRDNRRL